jgi:hypothetical protein
MPNRGFFGSSDSNLGHRGWVQFYTAFRIKKPEGSPTSGRNRARPHPRLQEVIGLPLTKIEEMRRKGFHGKSGWRTNAGSRARASGLQRTLFKKGSPEDEVKAVCREAGIICTLRSSRILHPLPVLTSEGLIGVREVKRVTSLEARRTRTAFLPCCFPIQPSGWSVPVVLRKSSIVRAGLLPKIPEFGWRDCVIRPLKTLPEASLPS